jgi:lysophospholipase
VRRPVGRVQIVHGLSEHIGRYDLLAAALNEADFSVFGHDHRGHGASEGRRGVVGRFPDLVEDVAHVTSLADELAPGPGAPFLVGHSLGGLVSIRYLQLGAPALQGAVISAPWLAMAEELPLRDRIAVSILRRVAPDWPLSRPLRPELLTRDEERARAFREDPLVGTSLAVSFFDQVTEAQARALEGGLPPGLPTLVLIPGADRLTNAGVTREWAERSGAERLELPETRHEPFNDIDRDTTFERIVEWLNLRMTTGPQEDG